MEYQLDATTLPTPEEYFIDRREGGCLFELPHATSVAAPGASTTSPLLDVVPNMNLDTLCSMAIVIMVSPFTKTLSLSELVANMQG